MRREEPPRSSRSPRLPRPNRSKRRRRTRRSPSLLRESHRPAVSPRPSRHSLSLSRSRRTRRSPSANAREIIVRVRAIRARGHLLNRSPKPKNLSKPRLKKRRMPSPTRHRRHKASRRGTGNACAIAKAGEMVPRRASLRPVRRPSNSLRLRVRPRLRGQLLRWCAARWQRA